MECMRVSRDLVTKESHRDSSTVRVFTLIIDRITIRIEEAMHLIEGCDVIDRLTLGFRGCSKLSLPPIDDIIDEITHQLAASSVGHVLGISEFMHKVFTIFGNCESVYFTI
jgi:hypothetical protein